ncbi:DUF6148 family protein [Cloacibacillus sp.]|uniref:DUF6148 family protein n=1 Tax=Cloacibacillus sp. TaxID=2049023 RepID=UPI0025C00CC7|nr:DUF6148 family protein [Cloacibacillus sp.]MCC8056422.1 DUF6148 family protein [Cloacibacillus sp.]MCC8177693.1 DUF6148 family protein [Cloacibacillus sp.]
MALTQARRQYIIQRLNLYLDAEEMVLKGQSYRIGSRSVTRADLPAIQAKIKELESELDNDGRKKRTVRIVPRDI